MLAFGSLLGTLEVLPIERSPSNGAPRYLTFEYIGPTDYFSEGVGGERTRGAQCTSVDAAFLHRTAVGVELVLIEWKYTESYRLRLPDPKRDEVRRARYWPHLAMEDSPVRVDLLDFVDLLDEPLYQLMRQQLLARALERDHAEGAGTVRVVHVIPKSNLAYQQSLHRESQRAHGATVSEVWSKLLRTLDRFVPVDSSIFLDPAVTSDEYVLRYG